MGRIHYAILSETLELNQKEEEIISLAPMSLDSNCVEENESHKTSDRDSKYNSSECHQFDSLTPFGESIRGDYEPQQLKSSNHKSIYLEGHFLIGW